MKSRHAEQVDLVVDFAATTGQLRTIKGAGDRAIEYFFSYQPLDWRRSLKVRQKLSKLKPIMVREKAVKRMNPFIFIGEMQGIKQGIKQGIRKGRQAGESGLVLRQLRRRLGPLPAARCRAIESLPLHKIEALGEALLDFHSPEDLARWLQKNAAPRRTARAPQPGRHK